MDQTSKGHDSAAFPIFDFSQVTVTGLTGGMIGGVNGAVQYNDTGAFGGDLGFNFDETQDALRLGVVSSSTGRLRLASALSALLTTLQSGDTPATAFVFKLPADNPVAGDVLTVTSFVSPTIVTEWAPGPSTMFPLLAPDGSSGAPSYSFLSDPTTGIFFDSGGGFLNFTVAATLIAALDSSSLSIGGDVIVSGGFFPSNGAVGLPAYTFGGDPDTGMYSGGANVLAFAAGGVNSLSISTTAITSTVPVRGPDGTQAIPAFSFASDTDTGIFNGGGNLLTFTVGGTSRVSIDANGNIVVFGAGAVQPSVGSAANPTHSFQTDTNTGMYSSGADTINFSTGAGLRLTLSATGAIFTVRLGCSSLGVGNSAAATVPGAVTKKIEVFDVAGASLGFLAVYAAIT